MKSFSAKDFEVQWFSGTGKGGQHRNKHQNCCRIIHKETALRATGQRSRERAANLDSAFRALAAKLMAFYSAPEERRCSKDVVRTYHFERGEVVDHASGERAQIGPVIDGDIGRFLTHPNREGKRQQSGRG